MCMPQYVQFCHSASTCLMKSSVKCMHGWLIRVESGLDDPDNVGHFFDGSSGSHPQTKLSGCDPDFWYIRCLLEYGSK